LVSIMKIFCAAGLLAVPACCLETANPNALPDAKRILNFFESLSSRPDGRVVSGQFGGWGNELTNGYRNDLVQLNAGTGKWVGLLGTDWNDFNSGTGFKPQELINWWKAGGLVTVGFHYANPFSGGSSWSATGNLGDLMVSGTGANKKWMSMLDQTASNLKTLQDAGVIVLWRPLHEQNGGWFWWGNKNRDEFIAIWKGMFEYFTKTKGLNNLIWVFAPNYGANVTKYYPGDAYVDMVGLDAYFNSPKNFTLTGYAEMAALGKPFGLTEFGGVPAAGGSRNVFDNAVLIKEIKAKYPKTAFFLNWHCPWSIQCQDNPGGLLNDPWVLTRDELDWKSAPVVSTALPHARRNLPGREAWRALGSAWPGSSIAFLPGGLGGPVDAAGRTHSIPSRTLRIHPPQSAKGIYPTKPEQEHP
jgi:mannan endo-1,4-beta-mannosidase